MPRCRLGEEAPSPSVILRCTFKTAPFLQVSFYPLTPFLTLREPGLPFRPKPGTHTLAAAADCQRGPGSCWTARLALPLNLLSSAPQSLGTVTWKPRASAWSVSESKRVPMHLHSHPAFESLGTLLQSFKAQGISLTRCLGLYTFTLFLALNFAVELKGTNANTYLFFSLLLAK